MQRLTAPAPATDYRLVVDKLEINLEYCPYNNSGSNSTYEIIEDLFNLDNSNPVDLTTINTATAAASYAYKKYSLIKTICKHNSYHVSYRVQYAGNEIGTIYLDTTKKYFKEMEGNVLFIANNGFLYTRYAPILSDFLKDFNLKLKSVKRLDIALDTNTNLIENFNYYFQQPGQYRLVTGGKHKNYISTVAREYATGEIVKTLYIGSSDMKANTGKKRIVIYDKTEQLKVQAKPYITEFHKANGLDITKPIYRMELQLFSRLFKTYKTVYQEPNTNELLTPQTHRKLTAYNNSGSNSTSKTDIYHKKSNIQEVRIELGKLNDTQYLAEIFFRFKDKTLKFRRLDNPVITRCTGIDFIEKNNINKMTIHNTLVPSKNNNYVREKKQIRDILKIFVQTGERYHLSYAEKFARDCGLQEFLQKEIMANGIDLNPVTSGSGYSIW